MHTGEGMYPVRYLALSGGDADTTSETASSEDERLIAQRLHTDFLLEGGHIVAADLAEDGLYYDEYSQYSSYVVVSNELRTAACRLISPVEIEDGIMGLPTLRYFSMFPQSEDEVGQRLAPESLDSSEVIEVSALIATFPQENKKGSAATLDATHLLCSTVLRDSLDSGHRLWVMNIQENLRRTLNLFLGHDQVYKIGDPMFYYRPDAIPCAAEPEKAVQSMLMGKSRLREYRLGCLRETMAGVNERYLSSETIQLLHDADIPTTPMRAESEVSSGEAASLLVGGMAVRYSVPS